MFVGFLVKFLKNEIDSMVNLIIMVDMTYISIN